MIKRVVVLLAVLLLTVPAVAAVSITATDEGGGIVAITYTADANVSAFGLDITVTDGNIIDVNNYFETGESNSVSKGFGIFLDKINGITINQNTGVVLGWGSPVAHPSAPGAQNHSTGVTIEMGALYEDGNQPPLSGQLCKVKVSENCFLNVTVNPTRAGKSPGGQDAGVVMEDGTAAVPDLTNATNIRICNCYGDITSTMADPHGAGSGSTGKPDIGYLVTYLVTYGDFPVYSIANTDPNYNKCYDMDPGGPGGAVNKPDIGYLVTYLTVCGSFPVYNCPCPISVAP